MYDSEQVGAEFGTRGTFAVDRVLLFRSEDTALDLVIQPGSDGMCFLHGTITDSEQDTPLMGARIRLSCSGDTAETDEFGQFASSCLADDATWSLQVDTPDRRVTCVIRNAGD